jgi:hypothetical protein
MFRRGFGIVAWLPILLAAAAAPAAEPAFSAPPELPQAQNVAEGTEYGVDWFDSQPAGPFRPIEPHAAGAGPLAGWVSLTHFPYVAGPNWTANTSAVILRRSRVASRSLVTDFGTGAELLDTRDVGLGTASGPRVEVVRHFNDGSAIEASYFSVESWNGSAQVLTGGVLQFPHLSGTPFPSWPYNEARVFYGSDLHNVEFNVSRPWTERLSWLAGFRYAYLREYARVHGTLTGVAELESTVRTYNNLYGMQLGLDYTLWDDGGPLNVDILLKGGVYGNDAHRKTYASHTLVAGDSETRANRGHTSFVGEFRLTAHYQLTPCMSVFGGYEIVWYDGVALAPNQLATADGIDFGDTAFLQGSFVGLEMNW